MIQLTLDMEYYTPLCSCEGCFRDSTDVLQIATEQFDLCKYHYKELMLVDDWNTERMTKQIMVTPLAKALEYREEVFQYNNKN
mgnify:FL=1|jgi:hypothetical protein